MNQRTFPLDGLPGDSGSSAEEPGRGPAKGPLETFIFPLYRSRWWVAAAILLGTIGGGIVGALRPNEYSSTGKLLLRVGERERIAPDVVDDPSGSGAAQVLSNELHLLGNEAVYRRAARRVGARRLLAPYDPSARYEPTESPTAVAWMHRLQSWWFRKQASQHECADELCEQCLHTAQQILMNPGRTAISLAPRSNVLVVRHTAQDGALSKKVVDALIAEFDLRHQEIYTARGAVQLLKRAQEDVLREAQQADEALFRTQDELGIADLPTERQKLIDAKYELDREIAAVLLDIKLTERELARLETQLAEIVPATEPVLELNWEKNPAYEKQEQVIDGLRRRLAELRITYSADTQPVRNIESDIAREESALAAIMPFIKVESFRAPANEEHTRLTGLVADSRAELSALVTRRTDKEALRVSIAERLRYLSECEPQLAELKMRSQILRKAAEEAAAALENKRVLESLDEAQISNLVVLDWGTNPVKSGPDRKKLLLIGAFIGLALGSAFSFARSSLDGRVHGAAELERVVGAPTLAVIPLARGLPGGSRT